MAVSTKPDSKHTDEYGIERTHEDEPGKIAELREKWGWFDHLMLMQERYAKMGGNQYAAGITYFSVLSMFPILMLLFAGAAFALVNDPDTLRQIQDEITKTVNGTVGDTLNEVIDTAIEQRSAIAGIGGLTALWSGLSWMNHLRYGASKMWKANPIAGGFVGRKLMDLVGLLMLLVALIIAFGITAVGSSGLTRYVLEFLGLEQIPGIDVITQVVAIAIGLIANYLVFLWLLKYLPRTDVPWRSAAKGAAIGAVAFEIFKQIGSLFFSNALNNPAGATFGPIIGVMVLFYFVWRILLYCCAWTATTDESLARSKVPAPEPAVIRVRNEVDPVDRMRDKSSLVSTGFAAGAVVSAAVLALRNVWRH
ncbi:YhjD/YihY/BrkB family envelope integrity protein [Corynebacterium choanae]|uniref:Inner membrane protein YhjD n=1 Tax=Corynebacterium choanae TaxID=1862358 RepID=A0A3G6J8V0_9CORY|nr:Inner membrane protein YhjD [Corynebacterium choanae]